MTLISNSFQEKRSNPWTLMPFLLEGLSIYCLNKRWIGAVYRIHPRYVPLEKGRP